jgi:autotransporter-associated beta strand protein
MKTKASIIQNPLAVLSWRSCLQTWVALAILCLGSMAHAQGFQADTWIGLGANSSWTTTNNWTNAVSGYGMTTNGDDLTFAASPLPAPNNNFTGLQIDSLTISTNGYAIGGNALTITNGITDSAGSNTISIPLTLGASQTFQNTSGGTTNNVTTLSGTIALGTNNLNVGGNGYVYLNGIVSSAVGGSLTVNSGGIAQLGPSSGSAGNSFGTNGVFTTTTSTNTIYATNTTYATNVIQNGTPWVIITNTVITTNSTYTYVTNAIVSVPDVVAVQSGTLQFGGTVSGNHIPNGAGVGNVLLNGTLNMNGVASETVNGLDGSGTVDILNPAGGAFNLTVGNGNSNGVFSGIIQNTYGSIALTKTGFGTETLDGGNTYSGVTTISQGTLAVGFGGSLGLASKSMIIAPGAVLDVSALDPNGYYPQSSFNLNAGTPTKPYTNYFGSYSPAYTNGYVVTTTTNTTTTYTTNETVVPNVSTNINSIATNTMVTTTLSSNSIVNVINADVNGNFSLYGGSFTPVAPAPGYAIFTVNGNLTLDNSLGAVNNLNFLLNNVTNAGGGLNDLIVVTNGTLNIGDTVNIVVSPASGTLATGKYTLIESTNFVSGGDINGSGPANFIVVAPRGITGVIDTVSQPGNVLMSASGTATPGSIVWSAHSAASNTWDIDVTKNWKNGGSPDYFFSLDNVTFDDTGYGAVTLFGPVTPGSMTFNNNNTNYTFAANTENFIAGGGGITLNGSGTVTLNNPNAFTGPVTLNNGTLTLGNFGGYANQTVYNGVAPGQLVFGGNASLNLVQTIANVSALANFAGLTLNSGANGQIETLGTRQANDLAEVTIGGNIIRNVGSSLYVGGFTLKANTANNGIYFTNTIPWTNGLLGGGWAHDGSDWLAAQTNYGSSPNNNPASGNYNYTGYPLANLTNFVSTNNIAITNSTFAVTGSSNIYTLKLQGPVTVNQTAGTTLTILSGGLLASQAGTGASTITGGTLKGAPGADLIVLQNLTGANTLTIGSVIADNGSATALTLGGLGGTLILTNNNTYTGATYINAGSLQVGAGAALGSISTSSGIIDNGGTLSFNRPDSTSVGAVSGLGGITQLGTGILTLTANNTLSGLVTISAGTLQVGNGGAAGSISNITSVVDGGTLVFNNSSTVGFGGVISGAGGVLVQNGSGTLILTNHETYTGNTVVSNGTVALSASGSISNTTAIVVNSGATFDASAAGGLALRGALPSEILAGSGTINGTVTVTNGTKVTPGTNGVIGTLTFNNDLDVNGGNLVFDIGNSSSDKIVVGGALNQNSGNVLVNVTGAPLTNGLYQLVTATGGLNGTSANNLIAIGFLQSGQLAVLTNSTANELDLYVYSGIAPSVVWLGDGSQNLWDTTASSKWQAAALYTQGAFVTFDDSGSASPAVNLDIVEYPASVTVNSTNSNYTLGVNGGSGVNRISGGATLTKNGPGTLTLQTVNDYVGSTTINGGTIQLNGDGGVNDDGMIGAGSFTNNGTLIASNANTETIAGNISGSGSLFQMGVGALILTGSNSAYSGPITIAFTNNSLQVGNGVSGTLGTGAVTNNGKLLFNVGGSVAVSPNISGSGSVTNVAGTVTLNGTNTYAGSTTVSGGKLVLGSASALPATTTLVLNDGNAPVGTLDLDGNNFTVPVLVGNNTGSGLSTINEGLILNNGTTTNTLTINGGTTNTYNGQILDNNNSGTGKVALSIINGSYLTLFTQPNAAGALPFPNSFSGGITVSNGTLAVGAVASSTPTAEGTDALGNPSGTQNILMTGSTNDYFYAGAYSGSTTPTIQTTVGTLTVTTNTTAWFYGPQRGELAVTTLTGSGNIVYQPNYVRNRFTFGNASGFTGVATMMDIVNTGDGAMGYDGALGLPNAALVFGITNTSTVQFYGSTTIGAGNVVPFGSLAGGDNTAEMAGSSENAGANVIYSIGGLNTSTTYGGQIVDGVGFRKVGTGTLTLTNTVLSWTGQTVVSNGTLAFAPHTTTNALAANYLVSSNYTLVSPGILDVSAVGGTLYLGHNGVQTLYGNGTINGSLVVSNSLIAPGRRASFGATNFTGSGLTVTNTITMLSGSTNVLGIMGTNAPINDSLTAVHITYGGTLTITNFGTAFANGSSNVFQLFNGTISGSFAATNLPAVANSVWVTSQLGVNGSIALVNTNSAINTNAFTLTNTFSGGNLTLSWPADHTGFRLQAQTNSLTVGLFTNWVDIDATFTPAANTTNKVIIPVNPGNASVFYRLIYP